jgi:hypothetical protein
MSDRELMQQALDALNHVNVQDRVQIITALRERLAQPEQCQCPACKIAPHASDCAVHNAPAYPVGACDCGAQPYPENFIDALKFDVAKRDFEARLNLDPTPISGWGRQSIGMGVNQSEPEQKTCLVTDESCKHGSWCSEVYCQEHCEFRAPPQRKPLTDEEIESINVRFVGRRDLARLFARAIEAAHGIKENT